MDKKKVARGSLYIFLNHIAITVLKVFLVFFLARILGPSKYGKYSVVFAFCTIVEVFFRSGLTDSVIKNIAEDEKKTRSLADFGFIGQLVWSSLVFLVIFLGAGFWAKHIFNDDSLAFTLKIASLYFVPTALLVMAYSIFQARREFARRALVEFIWFVLRFIMVLIFLLKWKSVDSVFYAIFLASLIALIPIRFIAPRIEAKRTHIDIRKILTVAFFLLISAVTIKAVFQVDKIFIKHILREDSIVGTYALASNFAAILQLFAVALAATLFPSMVASFAKADTTLTHKYLKEGTRYLLLVLVPVSFGLAVAGKDVFLFMFGKEYLGATKPFVILVFGSVLFSFFLLYRRLLVALNKYLMSMLITILVLAGALVLNPLFIKRFGVIGAAWATFIFSAVGATVSGFYVFRLLRFSYPWLSFLRILISSIIWFCLANLVSGLSPVIRYSVYLVLTLSYPLFLYSIRELTKEDWQVVMGIINK